LQHFVGYKPEHAGHAEATHPVHTLEVQLPEVQSAGNEHALPVAHFAHVPPQSTSVSDPSLTLSVHPSTHAEFRQVCESQSVLTVHAEPAGQAPQLPPQSTSVSVPLIRPSKQPAETENRSQT
jgi:hypothetical protein